MGEVTSQVLQAYIHDKRPQYRDHSVENLISLNEGWESDVYAFDLAPLRLQIDAPEALILRIYPGVDALAKSRLEYDALQRLYGAGYPVPPVFELETDHSPFGKPFIIMARIDGQQLWEHIFRGPAGKQKGYFEAFCRLFVDLHTLDLRYFVSSGEGQTVYDPFYFFDRELAGYRSYAERYPMDGFAESLQWLADRREVVPCRKPALVHLDFHPGNLLLKQDGTLVVIDWTQFTISDPRFDIAWTMTLVSSYEGVIWRDRILHTYQQLASAAVEHIEVFEVFAALKRLASVALSLTLGAEQLGMRPGSEALMLSQLPALQHVYTRLLSITDIKIPQVEHLFKEKL